MEIIKTSIPQTAVEEIYILTSSPRIKKMSEIVGSTLTVSDYCIYTDTDASGNPMTIVSIKNVKNDEIYATNSKSFTREFSKILDITNEQIIGKEIIVLSGTSKAGRTFITCSL